MKAKTTKMALVVGLFVTILVSLPSLHRHWREYSLTREVKRLQIALERYHLQHRTYPESFSAAAIQEPEEIYYQREADGSYTLWFGMGLGESVTFPSPERTSL